MHALFSNHRWRLFARHSVRRMKSIGVELELAERDKKQIHSNSKVISKCPIQLPPNIFMCYANTTPTPPTFKKTDPTLLQLYVKNRQLRSRSCPSLLQGIIYDKSMYALSDRIQERT